MKHPLAIAVEQYALAHYESSEWDTIYETYDELEILDELNRHNITSPEDAIAHFQSIVDIRAGSDFAGNWIQKGEW